MTHGNIIINSNLWKIIKLFLSNKDHLENVDIMLNHNNKIICNDHELFKIFNLHCFNIIEKPTNIIKEYNLDNKTAVDIICNPYNEHPSILKIRSTITVNKNTNNNTIF